MVIDLYKQDPRQLLGSITEADLKVLIDALEEESADDRDYYIDAATIDVIADGRAIGHDDVGEDHGSGREARDGDEHAVIDRIDPAARSESPPQQLDRDEAATNGAVRLVRNRREQFPQRWPLDSRVRPSAAWSRPAHDVPTARGFTRSGCRAANVRSGADGSRP